MNRDVWLNLKSQIKINIVNWPTTLIFIFDIFLIFTSWNLFSEGLIFKILSYFLASIAFLQLYLILHEATHGAVSKSVLMNNFIGHLCGFVVLMPFLPRQNSHLLHHTWTGHPVRDPANNRMIQKFSVITDKDIKKLEKIWKYWIPAIIINDRIGLWLSPYKLKKQEHITKKTEKELFWNRFYIINYILFFTFLAAFYQLTTFVVWFIPSITISFLIEELVNLPHHAESPLLEPSDKAIPYWEQQLVTHSCESIPIWSKYFILNFNLHVAHHFFPTAPWNLLPSLDKKIHYNIPDPEAQLNEFSWSIKNRRKPLMNLMGHYFGKKFSKGQVVTHE